MNVLLQWSRLILILHGNSLCFSTSDTDSYHPERKSRVYHLLHRRHSFPLTTMAEDYDELSSVRRRGGIASITSTSSFATHDAEGNWELQTQQVPAPVTQRPLPKFIHPPPPDGTPQVPAEIRIFPSLIRSPLPLAANSSS